MKIPLSARTEFARPANTFLSLRERAGVRVGTKKLGSASRSSGVALVVTLILLSVITFMAIAFLVLSHREQSSVTTTTDQSVALHGANTALEHAQAHMLAQIIASGNPFNIGLCVSTNYINFFGFTNGVVSPLNVNYDFVAGSGTALNTAQRLQNIANLQYNPRAPVYIVTNRLTGSNEFRFYLDLNRNHRFDPTGLIRETDIQGGLTSNLVQVIGDPHWIGELEFPDKPHSADNHFVFRFAYVVSPASDTLDVNYLHNQAANLSTSIVAPFGTDYRRNQGVGTWEINLAALLYDLNTNMYLRVPLAMFQPPFRPPSDSFPYAYNAFPTPANVHGVAFQDAASILSYRYQSPFQTLQRAADLFPPTGLPLLGASWIDLYSAGPIVTNAFSYRPAPNPYPVRLQSRSWAASDNTNHFVTLQEFFDPTKVGNLALRLSFISTNLDTYDSTTFYRMMAQLGTESSPEPRGKMNLNFDNLVQTNLNGVASATNLYAWAPTNFFANAADRLLAANGYSFTTTNIQVWPTSYYTPSVQRLLQLAANLCDSITNRPYNCPTIFRPIFQRATDHGTNILVIAGFREVLGQSHTLWLNTLTSPNFVDLTSVTNIAQLAQFNTYGQRFRPADRNEPMVWGVPLIVGARKGFPAFNEFSAVTKVDVTRLLEFRRNEALPADDPNNKVIHTNQMYVVSVTNACGLEGWNSYLTRYTNNLSVIASAVITATLTNGPFVYVTNFIAKSAVTNIANWPGWQSTLGGNSFFIPWSTNASAFLAASSFRPVQNRFVPFTHTFFTEERDRFDIPRWIVNLNTKVRFILYDTVAQRMVDYVALNYTEQPIDLMAKLAEGANNCADYHNPYTLWCTNRLNNSTSTNAPTYGIINQIMVGTSGNNADWASYSQDPYTGNDKPHAVDFFAFNLFGWSPRFSQLPVYKTNIFYAPFYPERSVYVKNSWQVNDPLVHYTIGDLFDTNYNFIIASQTGSTEYAPDNIGNVNPRYQPWNSQFGSSNPDVGTMDIAAKDPLVTRSDDWDFPTNKFANVGEIGRVHRGTPWQTIFLKSTNFLAEAPVAQTLYKWKNWTGNQWAFYNWSNRMTEATFTNGTLVHDALLSLPTNDWRILDVFTTALNENATSGRLSVNQTNLAAWSAVLSGVNVLSNSLSSSFAAPAGIYNPANPSAIVKIVNGINRTRQTFPGGSFQHLGDVLATPELTVASPYIGTANGGGVVNDAVYERIPQQIAGLLKGGEPPRFVIYSWAQTLKPSSKGVVQSGNFAGLVTNYVITAEVATRAVVRVDGAPNNPRSTVESFTILPPE